MASETAPLRAREETSVGLAAVHRYEAGDDLLLRERACPEPDAPAGESERGDVRTRIRRGLRLTMAAAGMVSGTERTPVYILMIAQPQKNISASLPPPPSFP